MDNTEIEIKISADTSDLEQSVEKATKKIDKEADKIDKSFSTLTKTLGKVKKTLNQAFSNNNTNLNGLTTQLSKLGTFATQTASKIQSTLKKAFNVDGKVTVKQETKTTSQSSSSSTGLMGDILTGSALGSKLQHGMAQMGKTIGDTVQKVLPQSFGKGLKESEGLISSFANKMMSVIDKITTTDFKLELVDTEKIARVTKLMSQFANTCDIMRTNIQETNQDINDFNTAKAVVQLDFLARSLRQIQAQAKRIDLDIEDLGLQKTIGRVEELRDTIRGLEGQEIDIRTFNSIQATMHNLSGTVDTMKNKFSTMAQESRTKIEMLNNSLRGKLNTALQMAGNQAKLMIVQFKNFKVVKTFDNLTAKVRKFGNALTQSVAGITFKDLQKHCQNLISKFKNVGKSAKKMGTDTKKATGMMKSGFMGLTSVLAPYLSLFAIFNGLKTSITSYTESLDDGAKFATVFGSETEDMTNWLNQLNSTVTTSKSTLMDFSTNLFNMGRNMKMSSEDAMDMSKEMTKLGADLEAFTGDANSIEALAGALRGEYDSLQNFGFALDNNAVEARALAMGLDASSESAKALARQSLIIEQSKMAGIFGYSAKHAQTLSGQLAMLRKNFQALGTAIGACFGGLLQLVIPVLNTIVNAVTTAFNKIASVINQVLSVFGIKVGGGGGGSAIGNAVGGITDSLGSGLDNAAGGASDVADNLSKGAKEAEKIAGLMQIDEINNLTSPDSGSGSGGGSGSGSGGAGGGLGGIGNIGDSLTFDSSVAGETEMKVGAFAQKIANALKFIGDNFKIGWESTGTYVTDSVTRLKDAFKSLGQAIEENLTDFANNGGDKLIQAIGRVSASLTGLAMNIGASVVEMVAGLVAHLNPEDNPVTRFFIDSLTKVLDATSSFAQSFGQWWDKLVEGGLGHFINVCGDVVMLLGGLLCDALGTVIGWVEAFFNSWAGQAILEGVAGFIDMIATAIEKLCIWLAENKEVVYAFAIGIGTVLAGAFIVAHGTIILIIAAITALVVGIGWLWDNWDEVWNWIKDLVSDMGKVIKTTFSYMVTTTKNKFNEIKKNAINIWNNIKTGISNAITTIKNTMVNIWNAIKTAISTTCTGIKNTVVNVWNNIKSTISTLVTSAKNVIVNTFNTAKTSVSNIFNGIKTAITTVLNNVKTTVSNVVSKITTSFKTGFEGAKTTVVNVFTSIKSKISSLINGAKDIVTSVIGKIKSAFKFTVSLPKIKLPHFSIKPKGWELGDLLKGSIPSLGISWYAKGGIMTKPTAFGMNGNNLMVGGEAGHEAILPLDKLWQEMNKNFKQQTETLAKMNNNGGDVHITLEMDGKQVAKGVYKRQKEMTQLGQMNWDFL